MSDRNKWLRAVICLMVCVFLITCTPLVKLLSGKAATAVVFFLETGKVLRSPPEPVTTLPPTTLPQTTEPPPTLPEGPAQPEEVPVFQPSDASLVQVQSYCGYDTDVPAWLTQPLSWDLQQEVPTVLILHSHATEGYENATGTNHRTQDIGENVVSVGDVLAQRLEAAGIRVLHDKSLHDYPSYSAAYENSRTAAQAYLEKYPDLSLILDLHRDSVADGEGNQIKYTVETPEGAAAKMMLVVGTDAGGLTHAKWPENMSLAVKLHAQLEKQCPGICRPISFRSQRFNQDLSTGALLIEMGTAGNSRQEALLAADVLADAIIDLANGTA